MNSRVVVCPDPVFIIGSPRSGTSILPWSLAEHSAFWTSGESLFLHFLFGRSEADRAYEASVAPSKTWLLQEGVDRAEFLASLGTGVNALFTSRSEGRRWIDQTPLYTLMADTLALMFPGARILHILRDGRRVAHSMLGFAKSALASGAARVPEWATGMGQAAKTWSRYVEASLDFCALNPDRAMTVTNEALSADPEKGFREILHFLEAPLEPGPAKFFRSNRINSSFQSNLSSGEEARIGAAGQDEEPWRSWSSEDWRLFIAEAGPTLVRANFVTESELRGFVDP